MHFVIMAEFQTKRRRLGRDRGLDMEAKILIVDDEEAVLSYLGVALAADGYTIIEAAGGPEALEIIRCEDFDLVLCDLMMADVNGLQVLREVREHRPDAAFILMSAYASLRSAITAIRLGASDYLLKPFDDDDLRSRVKNAIEKQTYKRKYEERTRELESFVFAISHDVAGHLVSMRGFSRRLKAKCAAELSQEACEYLDRVDASTEKMEKLVRAISDFARAGAPAGETAIVDLNMVVEEVLQNFHNAIEEKGVDVRVAANLPPIETEWVNAYQVFHNLVGNAIKYCREDATPLVEITFEDMGLHYRFCVRDNGIGVRKDEAEKIFEMFGRGDDGGKTPGTGLGLSIARRIVNKMGGRIWVESEERRGSAFYFTVPKAARAPRENAREDAAVKS